MDDYVSGLFWNSNTLFLNTRYYTWHSETDQRPYIVLLWFASVQEINDL